MKFLLVRHVETTGNAEDRFAGITDTEYTAKGLKQFITITNKLKEISFDVIYSSPISRALKIAEKTGEHHNLDVVVKKELSEMNFGLFENLTFKEINEKHTEHWMNWEKDFIHYALPQGDSLYKFHHRIAGFIDAIKEEEATSLIVCHGGTIQSILTHLLNLELEHRWHFHIPLGGLVEIEYKNHYGMMTKLISLIE
ncbi:MAG: histidine phosphatase family protein [Eubacteriales bacterium]